MREGEEKRREKRKREKKMEAFDGHFIVTKWKDTQSLGRERKKKKGKKKK